MLEILHAANINVANITVSRKDAGSDTDRNAFVFMSVDEDVPGNVLNLIRQSPRIREVSKMRLR